MKKAALGLLAGLVLVGLVVALWPQPERPRPSRPLVPPGAALSYEDDDAGPDAGLRCGF